MAVARKFLQRLLPRLSAAVWLLAAGRLLSQTGSGFTAFLAPIFFVNQLGLSATQVGLGLGSAAVSGVVGRALGGALADGRAGRRWTLIGSAIVSASASFVLTVATSFGVFVLANLLMGLGIGLYWPANEALVADLTTPTDRNEAFALTRLCDNLGLGLGVVMAGTLVSATGTYRPLFIVDGVSFLILAAMIYRWIQEPPRLAPLVEASQGWRMALGDRCLQTYALVNILFTAYIVLLTSTLPLYFSQFVALSETSKGFGPTTISRLFAWHLCLTVLCQLPVTRLLNRFGQVRTLMLSTLLWALGFVGIWFTGVAQGIPVLWAGLALAILTLAVVTYLPSASALVVQLAPASLRGVYLSINSQCWAVGALIAPPLGGWAMDQSIAIAQRFWLAVASSLLLAVAILQRLNHLMKQRSSRTDSPPDCRFNESKD